MRVSDLGPRLLICHKSDVDLLISHVPLQRGQAYISENLCIFAIEQSFDELDEILSNIPQYILRRYLDKFYLWTPEYPLERRQEVLDSLFQQIASEYESLVDVQRNLSNIRNLLTLLGQFVHPLSGSLIVDFGCGTGLSVGPASAYNVKLIGVDRCPKMRQIAASKGMTVWSPGQLAQQPRNSIDGAFASYVFHLLPDTHGLRLLWSRLRVGGALVANFHKNEGLKLVEACVRDLKGLVVRLPHNVDGGSHGTYVAFRKEK